MAISLWSDFTSFESLSPCKKIIHTYGFLVQNYPSPETSKITITQHHQDSYKHLVYQNCHYLCHTIEPGWRNLCNNQHFKVLAWDQESPKLGPTRRLLDPHDYTRARFKRATSMSFNINRGSLQRFCSSQLFRFSWDACSSSSSSSPKGSSISTSFCPSTASSTEPSSKDTHAIHHGKNSLFVASHTNQSQNLQFCWFVGHIMVSVGSILCLLNSIDFGRSRYSFYYKEVFTAAIITYSIAIHEAYNGKRSRPLTLQSILRDENIQYLMVALMWITTPPFTGSIPPFFIFSIFHVISYTRAYLLPALGVSDDSVLSEGLIETVQVFSSPLMYFSAFLELLTLLRLLFFALSFNMWTVVQFVVYFVFFKLRYNNSQPTRQVLKTWEIRVDSLVSLDAVPAPVKQGWISFKCSIAKYIGPLFVVAPVSQVPVDKVQ